MFSCCSCTLRLVGGIIRRFLQERKCLLYRFSLLRRLLNNIRWRSSLSHFQNLSHRNLPWLALIRVFRRNWFSALHFWVDGILQKIIEQSRHGFCVCHAEAQVLRRGFFQYDLFLRLVGRRHLRSLLFAQRNFVTHGYLCQLLVLRRLETELQQLWIRGDLLFLGSGLNSNLMSALLALVETFEELSFESKFTISRINGGLPLRHGWSIERLLNQTLGWVYIVVIGSFKNLCSFCNHERESIWFNCWFYKFILNVLFEFFQFLFYSWIYVTILFEFFFNSPN